MNKKVASKIKLNLPAGEASPAPPVGPVLGQHGVPIMDFVKQYNAETADKKGSVVPVEITVYEDRSFDFVTKLPPVSDYIKNVLDLEKAAEEPGRETIASLSEEQVEEIARKKLPDLNTNDLVAAKRIVIGTARSMGIEVEG